MLEGFLNSQYLGNEADFMTNVETQFVNLVQVIDNDRLYFLF